MSLSTIGGLWDAPNDYCLYPHVAAEEGLSLAPNDYCPYRYLTANALVTGQ